MKRPFYSKYAWVYDQIIERPAKERCDFIISQLSKHQISKGSRILDAGCGTGTYSIFLAEEGFEVIGVDYSPELIAEANKKGAKCSGVVNFKVGDILSLNEDITVDAILCRGVLNDLTEESIRKEVFSAFAGYLRKGGILIMDVREWESTAIRKAYNPVFKKEITIENGKLTFCSQTKLQPETKSLFVSETHEYQSIYGPEIDTFEFQMKCWTHQELIENLSASGFEVIECLGDYDAKTKLGSTDRMVTVSVLT
jgi:2-polyprenyl-3-methyl-5-hydroxy-6-metoxy-1,4-benzoquinol methylase